MVLLVSKSLQTYSPRHLEIEAPGAEDLFGMDRLKPYVNATQPSTRIIEGLMQLSW